MAEPAATAVSVNRQLFERRTRRSREAWAAALGVLPAGVSGAAKYYSPYPVFLASGDGGRVRDVDGNEYVDLLMGAGSILLGHCDRRIATAVATQMGQLGTALAPTTLERTYAERLRAHMPYLERLRFANTGSEANRSALRAARAYTGRTRYAKFEGNYHGSDDYFLFSSVSRSTLGPARRPEPVIDSHGVPASLTRDVVVLPFNDAQGAADLIRAHGDELAAVVMEPMAFSTGGAILADAEFADAVREATAEAGALLVFDEVVTAFRLGLAGAPGYLGVTPDLTCIGKAVGGGLPLAAFGGRADVMEDVLGLDRRTPHVPLRHVHGQPAVDRRRDGDARRARARARARADRRPRRRAAPWTRRGVPPPSARPRHRSRLGAPVASHRAGAAQPARRSRRRPRTCSPTSSSGCAPTACCGRRSTRRCSAQRTTMPMSIAW